MEREAADTFLEQSDRAWGNGRRAGASHGLWHVGWYAGLMLAAMTALLIVFHYGGGLSAPAPDASYASNAGSHSDGMTALGHLLIALCIVLFVGRLLAPLFRRMGQPAVIGELIGGLLLGPSALGLIFPEAYRYVFASTTVQHLGLVAQLGVVLYMFLVGVELNPGLMRGHVHSIVATSHASIIVPFVLGSVLSLFLYPRFGSSEVAFRDFALFVGIAMSITALPVLARILSDLGLTGAPLGVAALTCAAVDDVTAWCLLAIIIGLVEADTGAGLTIGLTLIFTAVMFSVVRWMIARMVSASGDAEPSGQQMASAIVLLLLASLVTEAIGVHALFGAFVCGVVIPHDSRLAAALTSALQGSVILLLLPAFFVLTGTRTELGLLSGWTAWLASGVIALVATVGKFGGTLLSARLTGMAWRPAAVLGVLMNTRGLMQLIVLNVGLDLGVLTPTLFTMMVVMAVVTTLATTPIVRRLIPSLETAPV
jgi:Kef-type K+ transport system membrane component KefB